MKNNLGVEKIGECKVPNCNPYSLNCLICSYFKTSSIYKTFLDESLELYKDLVIKNYNKCKHQEDEKHNC